MMSRLVNQLQHSNVIVERTHSEDDVMKLARGCGTCLKVASWAVALWWLTMWLVYPTNVGNVFKEHLSFQVGNSSFFGTSATYYVVYTCPVIALAILALLHLELIKRFPQIKEERSKRQRGWRSRWARCMWTQPVVVRSPLGILTAVDVVGIAVVLLVVVCFTANLTVPARFDSNNHVEEKRWQVKLDKSGELFGKVIPFAMTLLFIPATRGSPILRLIRVPFEHAVRYHRWLGHLTMLLITTHGTLYSMYHHSRHETHMVVEWRYSPEGIANLPGVVAAMAGILMWITALAPVRTRWFNLFYGMHHMYIVVFAFYAWHVGKGNMGKCMGGVFLFFLDRFLRMVQSRSQVTGVSAQVLPSGIVELKIPVKQGFEYNALSFLYINVPGISLLEWHPFSTLGTGSGTMSVCIKPLGDWTCRLQAAVVENLATRSLECLKLHAEGPYGHESDYFLRYKNLMLVAGGAGITPFLAILSDLLKRHQLKQENSPVCVQVVWCVRSVSEVSTLRGIRPGHICPSFSDSLTLGVEVFVTRDNSSTAINNDFTQFESKVLEFEDTCTDHKQDGISCLTPTTSSQNLYMMAIILASVAGVILMSGLFNRYESTSAHNRFPMALDVFLFFISTGVGILVCGGAVLLLWSPAWNCRLSSISPPALPNLCPTNLTAEDSRKDVIKRDMDLEAQPATLMDMCTITQGLRPQFQDIFANAARRYRGEEAGVLVCGPNGLRESVALECRSQNFRNQQAQFHFHSVSFDL